MKKMMVMFITICLLLVPIAAVQAQSTWFVSLDEDFTEIVPAGHDIVLRLGWFACTPGFVRQYQSTARFELELDGQPLITPGKNDQYFTAVEPFDGFFGYECLIPPHDQKRSITDWRYPLGPLPEGDYTIYFRLWLDNRLFDGYDLDFDGKLDVYEGTMVEITKTLLVR